MAKLNVTISEIIKETSDVKTFRLKFNDGENMPFLPGQFVMVALEDNSKNAKAYSMSSSSFANGGVDITVKVYPEGAFSPLLDKAKIGDKIFINGPFGHFNYRKEMGDEIVLIAAGSGIAPFRSIINTILDNNWDTKVTLLNSSKTPGDLIYKKEIEEWNKKIKVVNTITRPDESKEGWKGNTGRIDKNMIENNIDNKNALFYLCGPKEMVDNLREVLESLGVNKEKIKFERWV